MLEAGDIWLSSSSSPLQISASPLGDGVVFGPGFVGFRGGFVGDETGGDTWAVIFWG